MIKQNYWCPGLPCNEVSKNVIPAWICLWHDLYAINHSLSHVCMYYLLQVPPMLVAPHSRLLFLRLFLQVIADPALQKANSGMLIT